MSERGKGTSKRERRFRISCFRADQPLSTIPLSHFAPKTRERAEVVFERERRRILAGEIGRVVMHQGNLMGEAYRIVRDRQGWTEADQLTIDLTAFDSFDDLLNAKGGYFPSLRTHTNKRMNRLADLYDQSGQATPEEHQEWLDGASDSEIASWVVGYTR